LVRENHEKWLQKVNIAMQKSLCTFCTICTIEGESAESANSARQKFA